MYIFRVLIVAKCIVNFSILDKSAFFILVLIVAKCIVNLGNILLNVTGVKEY